MKAVPILIYHALENPQNPSKAENAGERKYVLDANVFSSQMEYLFKNNYKTLLLQELILKEYIPDRAVVITFDDGHYSNLTVALPVLQKYGFKAEFFITTGWINTRKYLSSDGIRILVSAGMSIGSHGVTHSFLDDLSDEEINMELSESLGILSKIIRAPVVNFSPPGGRINSEAVNIAKKLGYRAICTSRFGTYNLGTLPYAIPRIPIKRDLALLDFIRIINLDVVLFLRLKIRYATLFVMKKMLGNKLYKRFHEISW